MTSDGDSRESDSDTRARLVEKLKELATEMREDAQASRDAADAAVTEVAALNRLYARKVDEIMALLAAPEEARQDSAALAAEIVTALVLHCEKEHMTIGERRCCREVVSAIVEPLKAEIARLEQERDEALKVIADFMTKWPEVERHVNGFIGLQHARSGGTHVYQGPNISDELARMKALTPEDQP